MAKKKTVEAPTRIEWRLRYRRKCTSCGKTITSDEDLCKSCKKRKK